MPATKTVRKMDSAIQEANPAPESAIPAVRLLGVADVIVTRGWAYQWYLRTGCDPHARGFGSADYMAFGRPSVDLPLTDVEEPTMARFLANVAAVQKTDAPKGEGASIVAGAGVV